MAFDLRDELQKALGDNYVIERELSPGGMSRLFLATESSLERKVVIKLLPPETASEVSAARFHREVLVAAKLQHPNILPVLTTGTTGELFFYIMPYVAGESLRHRLEKGPFPVPEALRVVREIADALASRIRAGSFTETSSPRTFCCKKATRSSPISASLARSRRPGWIPPPSASRRQAWRSGRRGTWRPEQLSGERDLDARADVYALAVVAYEMLAGKPPFERPTFQALVTAHLTEPPPPLSTVAPDVPPAIGAVIAKALAKAPDDRYYVGGGVPRRARSADDGGVSGRGASATERGRRS